MKDGHAHEVAQVAPGQLRMRLVIRETDHVITAGLASRSGFT